MKLYILPVLLLVLLMAACHQTQSTTGEPTSTTLATARADSATKVATLLEPEWAKNATIYEVNTRQFSAAGTFNAVTQQLPRLKELGVDIVWFMPIYPISQTNKRGTSGNPYAVANYTAVNPEFGTMADFKALVKRAHGLGLRVMLDWSANHTGADHTWVKQHPDWYTLRKGKMTPPVTNNGTVTDWNDVLDLNYDNSDLRKAMISAMQFWLKETDVDGFRCEVSGMVPTNFWAEARPKLTQIKPVFMLSENEDQADHFKAGFNANYSWAMFTMFKAIAKEHQPATGIDSVLAMNQKRFPVWYYQMLFTQNHDENAKGGSLAETFGPSADAFIVLTCTMDGMPLIYNGMESGLNRRLSFYDKDTIQWGNYGRTDFYNKLFTLKHRNRALWNGMAGGKLIKIPTDHDEAVYAFTRQKENDQIAVIANLTDQPQTVRIGGEGYEGKYIEIFSRQLTELKPGMRLTLKPWEYRVLTN
jgi:alpha-amylase